MEYIIFDNSIYANIRHDKAKSLGLDCPRKSADGNKVLMEVGNFCKLFGKTADENCGVIIDSESEEFAMLLSSDNWVSVAKL